MDVARGSVLERLYVGAQVQLRDDGNGFMTPSG